MNSHGKCMYGGSMHTHLAIMFNIAFVAVAARIIHDIKYKRIKYCLEIIYYYVLGITY